MCAVGGTFARMPTGSALTQRAASITARRDRALVSEEGTTPSYGRSRCVPGAFRGTEARQCGHLVTRSRHWGCEEPRDGRGCSREGMVAASEHASARANG